MNRAFPAAIAAGFLACSPAMAASVPRQEGTLEFAVTGRSWLVENGREIVRQSVTTAAVSWLQREPLPKTGWYWAWGIRADRITFANDRDFSLVRIQDCAAQFTVECFVGTEAVAGLTLSPGLYFENRPTSAAWDVPIEFECGVPLSGGWSGVLGFNAARFYRRPVPVVGVVWTAGLRGRVEVVFPNPTVVVRLDSRTEARLGGELEGTGFLSDAKPTRHKIEYSGYRATGKVTRDILPGLKVTLAAGREFERLFDYLQGSRRVSARGSLYFQLRAEFTR